MMELRVFLQSKCLLNPPPSPPEPDPESQLRFGAGLLALLVPEVLKMVITGVAGALEEAGADKTDHLSAEDFIELYEAGPNQALQVNPALVSILGVWFDPDRDAPPDDAVARTLKDAGLVPQKAGVGGVFEALIRSSYDGTAFFLDTRHFSVRDFIGTGRRRKDERDYVVTLTVSTPDATAEGSAFAVGRINLGRCRIGDDLVPLDQPLDVSPRHRSNLMPWSKISEVSKASYQRDLAAGRAKGHRYMPVAFSLTVSETADGSEFLLRLGKLLGGLAEKASDEIAKEIVPAEREKVAADEAERIETLYKEELKAELEVRKAENAVAVGQPADQPALRVALRLAERNLAWKTRLREAADLPAREPVP